MLQRYNYINTLFFQHYNIRKYKPAYKLPFYIPATLTNVKLILLRRSVNMDIEKRLNILQNTYAAAIAEAVNTYENLKVLEAVVEKRKGRQVQTAPYLNQQLGIQDAEDVFYKLSEIYGCANWSVAKTDDGYVATATSCKLSALSKKMGGANPCSGWCLDPMTAMLCDICKTDSSCITVEGTLMNSDCCKVIIHAGHINSESKNSADGA
jgi:hypothetical protein